MSLSVRAPDEVVGARPAERARMLGPVASSIVIITTFGFPKAGFLAGEFAVTAQLGVVVVAVWSWAISRPTGAERRLFAAIALSVWWFVLWSAIGATSGVAPRLVAQFAMLLLGPAGYFLGRRLHHRALGTLSVVTFVIAAYALVQWVVGVESTAIEGLTTSLGENIVRDNPLRTESGLIKAPSTYNNGNLFAASLLVAVAVVVLTRPPSRFRQRVVIAVAILAFALTLARSAFVGVGLASVIALIGSRRARAGMRGATLRAVVASIGALTVLASGAVGKNFISERLSETLADPTARGRTDEYAALGDAFTTNSVVANAARYLFGVSPRAVPGSAEGLALVFLRGGLVSVAVWGLTVMALFRLPVSAVRRHGRPWAPLLLCACMGGVLAQTLFDSVMFYPPIALNFGIGAGLITRHLPGTVVPSADSSASGRRARRSRRA